MPTYSWNLAIPSATPGAAGGGGVFSSQALSELPDWGFDIQTLPDLDTSFTPRRDVLSLADAFARRLFTPRGVLWSDPDYGFDVRDFLNDEITPGMLAAIRGGIEAQAEQEERILSCSARVTYEVETQILRIRVLLTSDLGPFGLVFSVGSLSTDIFLET